MPAWGERLTPDQIWQLVTYLRVLAAGEQGGVSPGTGPTG
jgi:mono/diheme cytochrome c family protein